MNKLLSSNTCACTVDIPLTVYLRQDWIQRIQLKTLCTWERQNFELQKWKVYMYLQNVIYASLYGNRQIVKWYQIVILNYHLSCIHNLALSISLFICYIQRHLKTVKSLSLLHTVKVFDFKTCAKISPFLLFQYPSTCTSEGKGWIPN